VLKLGRGTDKLSSENNTIYGCMTGIALEFASQELQSDREVVRAAVASNGCALGFASGELRADREVGRAATAWHRGARQISPGSGAWGQDDKGFTGGMQGRLCHRLACGSHVKAELRRHKG